MWEGLFTVLFILQDCICEIAAGDQVTEEGLVEEVTVVFINLKNLVSRGNSKIANEAERVKQVEG